MTGLYIHIPFCVRKCPYCDFYSVATASGTDATVNASVPSRDQPEFLEALDRELVGLPDGFRPATVFVGGGTPTELSDDDFRRLLDSLHRHVDLGGVVEWTCEANPGTLTPPKAGLFRPAGINRVSLGVQSFDPVTLRFLGRIHDGDQAEAGVHLLREAGIDNINLDLIYGTPAGAPGRLDADLERVATLAPNHVSCYCLTFEPDTPLARLRDLGRVREIQDDDALDQYRNVRRTLADAGYDQYEISNFAHPGAECRHNLLYWGGHDYLGCGPAAHSHWQGARFGNVRNLHRYCRALLDGASPRDFEERLAPEPKARETLVIGLRKLDGVDRSAFREQTGYDYRALAGETLDQFVRDGVLDDSGDRLRLTEAGLFVSDAVFAELV